MIAETAFCQEFYLMSLSVMQRFSLRQKLLYQ